MNENYTAPKLKPSKNLKSIFDLFEPVILALISVVVIFLFFARLTIVSGDSMKNTLNNKDYIVVSDFLLTYEPKRGDIVVIKGDFGKGANDTNYDNPIVKRVIATEGEKIRIEFYDRKTKIYINDSTTPYEIKGENYESSYYSPFSIREQFLNNPNYHVGSEYDYYEAVVKEGCVFVMGDNRYNSADSRLQEIGFVPEKYIIGKAIFGLMPFGSLYND